ncbi:MAG: hypothetical protein FWD09_01570 [Lentimicrobiaceae bacterium]|nr:hypothetical protein [Lentimicrobiaceae bacterium]
MKKLSLNKQAIAYLNNPERVFGGEGEAAQVPTTQQTCEQATCKTCPGDNTCNCPTYNNQFTCAPYPLVDVTCIPVTG